MSSLVTAELGTKENPHPTLPPIKDRIKGHYYIYNLEVRYWNGSRLINKEKRKEYNKKYHEKNKEKMKEQKKEYYENNKEKIKKKSKKYYEKNRETCCILVKKHYEKNKEEINKRRKEKFKNDVKYRERLRNRNYEYYENNKEKKKKKSKKYYEKNREKINTRYRERYKNDENFRKGQKLYRIKNREKINKLSRERYKKNPIKGILSSRLFSALKKKKAFKNKRTLDYVNCSVELVHNHIESQFGDSGMNWDNMGREDGEGGRGWEIDHRRPCASFDLNDEEQKYMCFHWTNLQPMWGLENNKKSDHYDPETFPYKWVDRETGWVGIPSYLMKK